MGDIHIILSNVHCYRLKSQFFGCFMLLMVNILYQCILVWKNSVSMWFDPRFLKPSECGDVGNCGGIIFLMLSFIIRITQLS